ncbi:MAG: Nucleolar Complex 2 protein [Candelina submexicana]|nr:MAG: Nucleolar Complex 2 protein [Candelina submexicana]
MAGQSKKATRKFEKNHLKDTIERRKEGKKIKQRQQVKAKKKARVAKENGAGNPEPEKAIANSKIPAKASKSDNPFGDMSVDEFFQGGFEIPEIPIEKTKNNLKIKEGHVKTKKRKRDDVEQDDDGNPSSNSSGEDNGVRSDNEPGSEAEDDFANHKGELDALAEKDPEFYKFLQENDSELLEFDEAGNLAEVDALSGTDDESTLKRKRKKSKKEVAELDEGSNEEDDGNEVTMAVLQKWKGALDDQHSMRAMRQVVLAFRAAAHVNEDDGKTYKYTISNSNVYHELLVMTLKHVPATLNHHLPAKETGSGKVRVPTDSKKFRTLTPLLKSHIASVHHLLTIISDAPTIKLTLSSILPLLPYLLSFKKLLRNLMKTVVTIWSDSSSTEAARVNAFLVIRRLAVISDSGLREDVLKTAYQGLVKGSRSTTVHTLQGMNLMKNSAAELWGIDPSIGYTTGFTFIRQLAIHLRGSITNNSKESYKTIYNWQYVHALDFWSRVLSSHCDALREAEAGKQSSLRPLIYPTVQITLGAMRLIPTAQYFPLRFHLIRSLLRISLATGTYIPLAPVLLEVLTSNEMKKSPKPSTLKSLDFATAIRAPKSYLKTRVYQDGVGEQVAELLSEFFVLWTKSIAFPELALPVTVMLKRWLKEVSNKATGNRNGKVNSTLGLVVQKLEANGRWIEERRAKVDFAPNDRAGVEGFLKDVEWEKSPLGAYVVGQRKTREEKARVVEESRREKERKRKEEREGSEEVMGDGVDPVVSDEEVDVDDDDE